jgi:hypothetical protein
LPHIQAEGFENHPYWIKTQAAINWLKSKNITNVAILGDVAGIEHIRGIPYTKPLLSLLERRFDDVCFHYIRGNHDDLQNYVFKNPIDWNKYECNISALPFSGGLELLNDKPDGKLIVLSHLPLFRLSHLAVDNDPNNYWHKKIPKNIELIRDTIRHKGGYAISGHFHIPKGEMFFSKKETEYHKIYVGSVAFAVSKEGYIDINDNEWACAHLDFEEPPVCGTYVHNGFI